MRKLILVLALLLITGVVYAAGIPLAADPKNAPEVWTQEVYNNYSAAITSGAVVVWDMASDSTDSSYAYRTGWVTSTVTADNIKVAGVVVDDSLPVGGVGTIAIYGPVYALAADSTDGSAANEVISTSTVRNNFGTYAAAANTGILGWCIYNAGVSPSYGGYAGATGYDNVMMPIFVNPSVADN